MSAVDTHADPLEQPSEFEPRSTGIAATFIRGNYFYVLSAVLMMLGCYMLMRSPVIEGTKFVRTLYTLLILQGYEVLLIVTAVVIVKRLRILDDALTLLLLEMILLLDPTFFSNSFFTMPGADGAIVNVVCFILVPIKLVILLKALRLRMPPRMFGAFLTACAVVFLAEGPMNFDPPPLGRNGFYYLLAWTPLLVALLLPPMKRMVHVESDREGYITDTQRALLPRFLMIAPVAVAAAHFIESSYIYTVRYYPMHTVPLLMALAVLAIHNTEPAADRTARAARCFALDALCVLSIVLSIPYKAFTGKMAALLSYTGPPPSFVIGPMPIAIAAVAAAAMYVYFYAKLDYGPALYRVAAIVVAGGGYGLVKVVLPPIQSAVAALRPVVEEGLTQAPDWLWSHFTKPGILVCAILLAVAVRYRKAWGWLAFVAAAVCWFGGILPRTLYESMPMLPECLLILALVLDHLFFAPGEKHRRYAVAAGIVAIGLARYLEEPAGWTFGVAAAEAVALAVAGYWLKHGKYGVAAAVAGGVLTVFEAKQSSVRFHPSVLVLAGGMASFLVGLLVTFYKQRILVWLQPAPQAAPTEVEQEEVWLFPPPEPPVDETLPPPDDDEPLPPTEDETPPPPDEGPPPLEEGPPLPEEEPPPPEEEPPPVDDIAPELVPPPEIVEEPLESSPETDAPIDGPAEEARRETERDIEASRIVPAEELEPDELRRIVEAARLTPDDKLLVCVKEDSPIEEWFAILTSDRLIVRRK